MKVPAAVIVATRGDMVLALTRPPSKWMLHLPGGKREDKDATMMHAAQREFAEETLFTDTVPSDFRQVCEFTSETGRPITGFRLRQNAADRLPETFCRTDAGQPMWAPASLLVTEPMPFARECQHVLMAASVLPRHGRPEIEEMIDRWQREDPGTMVNLAYRIHVLTCAEHRRGYLEYAEGLAEKLKRL